MSSNKRWIGGRPEGRWRRVLWAGAMLTYLFSAPAAAAEGLPDRIAQPDLEPEAAAPRSWIGTQTLSPLARAGIVVSHDTLYRWPARRYLRVGEAQAFGSIQRAINMAFDGDVIVVEPGTYAENLDFAGKQLALIAASGPSDTILDGRQCTRGLESCSTLSFTSGEALGTWVEGFTILGGSGTQVIEAERAAYDPRASRVSGVRLGVPTLGGGIFVRGASPTFARCEVQGGEATYGGGMAILGPNPTLIADNLTALRSGRHGGPLPIASEKSPPADVRIIRTAIVENLALLSGGGVYVDDGILTAQEGRVSGNQAFFGGGIASVASEVHLGSVELLKDSAGSQGGALHASRASQVNVVESALVEGWATQGALGYVVDSFLDIDGGWAAFPRRGVAIHARGLAEVVSAGVIAWQPEGEAIIETDGDSLAWVTEDFSLENPRFADLEPQRSWREDDLGAWRNGDPSAMPTLRVFAQVIDEEEVSLDQDPSPPALEDDALRDGMAIVD